MPLLTSIVNWLNTKRIYQIDLLRKYPFEVQQEGLFKLIDAAKNTEWGRNYGYDEMRNIADFQQRVPLQTYDDVKLYVERLRKGEKDVLWPGEIKWFAKSSGTTSDKSKFIPMSSESLESCHFRGGKDVLAIYTANYPDTTIFRGKGLTLGGSHKIDNFNNQAYYGDLSAILIENLPFWVDFIRTPRSEVALIDKWEEKLEKVTREALNENVTNMAGVPSWTMVLIKYILEKTGKNNLLEIWPNLELFTHGGVSFTPYRDQFKKYIPRDDMHYQETYNASEGFFAIQDEPDKNDMLLMLDYGVFYEFIPMDEFHKENPRAFHIGELETNKNYAIVISTNSGLWRYIIGDTVMFTSTFPHKIIITGRTKHFINTFGEEIIIENAEKALARACDKTHATISDYTAGPVYMDTQSKGCHEWLIEFEQAPENLDEFINELDRALQDVNSDYEAKRYKDITLEKPIVRSLANGTFYRWLDEKGKLGGQNKVPRLTNNRKYIEELMSIIERKPK
ncbi:MAG: hypothetical protein GVY19_01095 [Bacteroidetes bacterium]|jgi:hypothetical protein|nr:hypothetical protein [Bacteroidota bacterium]